MKYLRNYTFVDYATQAYMLLVGLLILVFHNETVPAWPWLVALHLAGLAVVHVLVQSHARSPATAPLSFLRHLYPVFLYIYFFAETGWLNRMFVRDFQDPAIIHWEQALFGAQPGVGFMLSFPQWWVSEMLYASYFSYYLMISGVGLLLFLRNRRHLFHFLSVLSFVFYVCYLIYIFLPVIGPRVFLNEFSEYRLPADLLTLAPDGFYPASVRSGPFFKIMGFIYNVFESPGAAFPSSHVAAALCTLYFSHRYLPRLFPAHAPLVLLLCFSTVYGRYHYAVDVLGGIVTAALLVPLGNWMYRRFAAKNPTEQRPAAAVDSKV